jgi:DNA repair protein RadC
LADLAERLRVVHVHSAELRPRDRLLRHGPVGLTDAELLAVLFRGGSSLEAAEGLLRDAGGLSELLATDRPALRRCCWPAGSCCDA